MVADAFWGTMIPFFGTSLGAACVFFLRGGWNLSLRRALTGFAAGVMAAASVWSLLLPAIAQNAQLGRLAFVPAAAGFWAGVGFMLLLDRCLSGLCAARPSDALARNAKLSLAVTLHNLPEGMAVGVAYAGLMQGAPGITAAGALSLALGIAIQNLPEGAIISMPLRADGMDARRSFVLGALSGAVEPVGALLTIWLAALATPALPAMLAFAAGAMLCVVVEELVPQAQSDARSDLGTLMFALGFTAMMSLDCALG